ncbi:hypothetical protein DJ71_18035, partial [Halorubrum sp. E3]
MKRTLVAALAVMLVLAPVAPFVAVGSASAAPAGMSTIPDANVAQDVPEGDSLALTASELEGGVMASQHADSLEVVLTTAENAPSVMDADTASVSGNGMAVVLRDDQESAGREVALDAGQLREALGYRPEAIYGTHENGEQWTASAEYVDGYLVFDVPHFSSNTVTFSGRITLSGTPSDGTQYQYSMQDGATVQDFAVNITGVTNTEWDNASASGLSDGDTLNTDIAGTVEPSGPDDGEPTVTFTGAETTTTQSKSGSNVISKSIGVSPAGNQPLRNQEITLTPDNLHKDTGYGPHSLSPGHSESVSVNTDIKTITEVRVDFGRSSYDVDGQNADFGIDWNQDGYTSDPGDFYDEETIGYFQYNTRTYDVGGVDVSGGTVSFDVEGGGTSDQHIDVDHLTLVGANAQTATIDFDDGGSKSVDLSGGTTTASLTNLTRDTSTVTATAGNGVVDYDLSYTEVRHTEDPSVSYGTAVGTTGVLAPGETVAKPLDGITTTDDSLSVSTANGTAVDVTVALKERTRTDSPKLEVNGNTVGTDLTLADGETRQYTLQKEWITTGTNQINVSLDGSASADAPDLVYELDYSHAATKRQEIDYSSGTFESSFTASTTYADDTTDAKVTFPFTGSVVGMESVEYRLNNGSWTDVSAENYRVRDKTTLVAYLSDASGGSLSAEDTIEVRATARKIEVANGDVSVADITQPGGELDTQLKVNSRSQGFHVNVGPTENGRRVHYAYSSVYPTDDYVVIEASGDQELHLPEAKTGDTVRVRHLDTRVVAERGDVRIDVVEAGENPELDVSPGPGGSGDPVTVEYYNTESGVTYLLNSLTRSIVVDSDVAQSPAIFEDDDSEDTWAILTDSGPTSSDGDSSGAVGQFREQAGDAVGAISLPIDGSGLGQLGLVGVLGIVGVVALRRVWPFGSDDAEAVTRDTSTDAGESNASAGLVGRAGGGLTAFASAFTAVGGREVRSTGSGLLTGLQRLLDYVGRVTAIILGNRRASLAAG